MAEEVKWTKGPWIAAKGKDNCCAEDDAVWGAIESEDEWNIARIWNDLPGGQPAANAKLISKAPDMADLLRGFTVATAHFKKSSIGELNRRGNKLLSEIDHG